MKDIYAVKCVLLKDDQLVGIKYNQEYQDYYDIPGGEIEEKENSKEACIREFEEETKMKVLDPKHRGKIIIESLGRRIHFDIYLATKYKGAPAKLEDNDAMWIDRKFFLKNKRFTNTVILEDQWLHLLFDNRKFVMMIEDTGTDGVITKLEWKYIEGEG